MAFEWPWENNFPPFFTIQPNDETRRKQLEAWQNFVIEYCRSNRLYSLSVSEAESSQLFTNKSINRKLPIDGVRMVVDKLVENKRAEWTDKSRNRFFVFWKTPEEWGEMLYTWATTAGLSNTVCTFYEIVNGDDTATEGFHGIDEDLLLLALRWLETRRKAEIIVIDEDSMGVKFF